MKSVAMGKGKKKQEKKAVANAVKSAVKAETKILAKEIKAMPLVKQAKQASGHLAPAAKQQVKQSYKDPAFLNYFRCLMDPDNKDKARFPDGFPVPTALVKSTQTIDVVGNFNATSVANGDGGRFSFHINPSLDHGDAEIPNGYLLVPKAGVINMSTNDANGNPIFLFDYVLGTKVASINPADPWAPGWINTGTPGPIPTDKTKRKSVDAKATLPARDPGALEALKAAQKDGVKRMGKPKKGFHAKIEGDFNIGSYSYYTDPNNEVIAGEAYGQGDIGGMATMVRPIAMSVWFQCDKSGLDNGGNVCACVLPSGTTTGQIVPLDWASGQENLGVLSDWTGYGPLQNWENLAMVPGNYNGKLVSGTYSFWVPQRNSDTEMMNLMKSAAYDYPTIMVSGQWSPNAGEAVNAASSLIGRLRIVTVYEYTSQSQNADLAYSSVSVNPLDKLKLLLHNQPTSMANGKHLAWIQKILAAAAGAVTGFALGGPAGGLEGAIGGYALGKKWAGE